MRPDAGMRHTSGGFPDVGPQKRAGLVYVQITGGDTQKALAPPRLWTTQVPLSLYFLTMPGGGLEPPRAFGPADFKSAVSTDSTIPAKKWRRRPDSNRGIRVLQTPALASWLRRLLGNLIFQNIDSNVQYPL